MSSKNEFSQSKNESQISFKKVRDCYGVNPIKINEVFRNGVGWINVKTVDGEDVQCSNKKVWEYAMDGITEFNFILVNKHKETRYPDFKLKELIRD